MNDLDHRLEVVQGRVNHDGVNWYTTLCWEYQACAQIIFPKSRRGLGHVTPQFLANDRTYLQNYLT